MKKKLLFIIVAVISLNLITVKEICAQTYQWDFQKYFQIGAQYKINSCEFIELSNGNRLYAMGVYESSTLRGYYYLVLLDQSNNVINKKLFSHCSTPLSPDNYVVKDVIELSNGNFAICGSIEKDCSCSVSDGGLILNVTNSLNFVAFDLYDDVRVWNAIKEIPEGYVMCGQTHTYQGIIARQENGNFVLSEQVDPSYACNSEYYDLIQINPDRFAAVGTRVIYDHDPILIVIEGANVLYSTTYETNGMTEETGKSITKLNDRLYLAGTYMTSLNDYYPLALEIDENTGQVNQSNIYDLNINDSVTEVEAIRVDNGDNVYISGTSKNDLFTPAFNNNGFIFGFQGNLNNVIDTRFYGGHDIILTDMNILSNNFPNASGFTFPNSMWVAERYPNILQTCNSIIITPKSIEYPLSAENLNFQSKTLDIIGIDFMVKTDTIKEIDICSKIFISSLKGASSIEKSIGEQNSENNLLRLKENESYEIYSINGKLIQSGHSNQTVESLNIESLPQGVYICIIKSVNGTKTKKIIR